MHLNNERLVSLDVFRGLTIAGMILVNNPGSWQYVYPPLRHARWNGCTPTDLIFPFFLFIAGTAITLSLTKRKEEGAADSALVFKILKRSLLIFFTGLFLNAFPEFEFSTLRIPGVLQRIALVYFISSFIFLKLKWKSIASLSAVFLAAYWMILTLIPLPGIGMPDISQPVITTDGVNKIAPNIVAWFDNIILNGHLWGATKIWDPEGIISTLPAVSTCLAGVLLGIYLKKSEDENLKTVRIFIAGNALAALGLVWDLAFPMNKSLWTSSFVLYTAGLALIVFAFCYWFADVRKIRWWTSPFVIYGTNAIAVYFLSGIFGDLLHMIKITLSSGDKISLSGYIYKNIFEAAFSPYNASLAWAIFYVLFWLLVMWFFYRKKIFIRL